MSTKRLTNLSMPSTWYVKSWDHGDAGIKKTNQLFQIQYVHGYRSALNTYLLAENDVAITFAFLAFTEQTLSIENI